MGLLVNGEWRDQWYDTDKHGGRFKRWDSAFRNWVTPDGAPGPTGEGGFAAEPGRYHLYVSLACPWAHRTLILRALKGLDGMIGVSVVNWLMGGQGWSFEDGPGVVKDPVHGVDFMHQLYTHVKPDYSGRVTVPVLYDKERDLIVSNESAEIIRMLNSAFDGVGATPGDYYPENLRAEIDAVNARVYDAVNNGVYKSGFATSQDAYEEAVYPLFATLDWLEDRLSTRRYLMGDRMTEADVRLFTTLVRFDAVYVGHFKCNLRRIVDYPNLWAYTRDLYQIPGVAETCDFQHMKRHYYESHDHVNPTGVVPAGPELDFDQPHGR
ncbi:MAG: glutathione S-transferase family protein [Alphaproteobacteria bacterium]|nr:glutathione S-transferase family protein [Alphaproteobacteria bacterium]